MMVTAATLGELLQKLEGFSDRSDDHAKTERKGIWDQITHLLDKSSRDFIAEVATGLEVSPVTVGRWMAGTYGPSPALLKKLREHFGLATPRESSLSSRVDTPDPPIPFAGSFAALRSLNHFFYCLDRAKASFVFKGLLEFHASHQQKTRSRVVEALEKNTQLVIYYVFPAVSRAANTFVELQKSVETDYPNVSAVLTRIRGIPVPAKNDQMGTNWSFASPFVVVYNEDGRKEFKRSVDIWYEIPVEPLNANNDVNDDRSLFVFVQLPSFNSKELWEKWRGDLKDLKDSSDKKFVDQNHLS